MRERKDDEDAELEGNKTKLIFICAEAGIKYIQNEPKTVRINSARAGETQERRTRGNDRDWKGRDVSGVWCGVVRRTIVLLGVVGVDVLGARARRAQSF